jgi:hypothetical protein
LTDAGAFQSISNRVISSEVGASSSGHPRDGAYATVSLWRASIPTRNSAGEASALNGDIYEAVLLEGDHEMWVGGSFDSRLDFTTRFKGDVSHNGVRGAGAQLIQPTRGQLYSYGEHDISYEFEDLSILWGDAWMWFRTYNNTLDHTASVTCNKCMLLGDVTVDQSTLEITSNTSATRYGSWIPNGFHTVGTVDYTFKNSLLLVGDNIARFADKGHLDIQGCTFYAHHDTGRIFTGGTDLTASIKGTIAHIGSTRLTPSRNIPLLNSFNSSNVTCTDYLSDEFNLNWVDASNTTNSSANIVFNYDGMVTSGQVNFLASGGGDLSSLDFRLVADVDNLAVRYMDLSSIYLTCSKDITGRKRPGSTDAGAFQSVSNRVVSASIGPDSSNEYGTASIWVNELDGSSVLNGDTFLLRTDAGLSGAKYVGANIGYGNAGTIKVLTMEVDHTIHFKSKEPVNGDWSSGTVLRSSDDLSNRIFLGNFKALRNNFNLIYEDFVLSGDSNQLPNNTGCIDIAHFHGDYPPTWWNSYGQETVSKTRVTYDNSVKFKNCMVTTYDMRQPIVRDLYDSRIVDSNGNTTYGKGTWEFENCVILGDSAGLGRLSLAGSLYNPITGYDVKVKGSTLVNCLGSNHLFNSIDGTHYYIDGSLIITGLSGLTESTLYADYFFGGRWHYDARNSTIHINDSIFSQASADLVLPEAGQVAGSGMLENSTASGFVTNAQYDVPINFDGTVSAGTVSFESSATKDYRLVPNQDNLAVQYTDSLIGSRDIAGEPRPGDGDAGAYQSITNTVSSFEIGSSAAGHFKDGAYATVSLWYAAERTSIQNGDIINLEFLSGTPHFLGGGDYHAFNEVNFDLNLKPASSVYHNGNWDEGVAVHVDIGNFRPWVADQSFSLKFEDLIVSGAAPGYAVSVRNAYATSGSCGAYDLDVTYRNCLLAFHRSALQAGVGAETRDSLGNLTEVGNYTFTLENCVSDSRDDYFTYFGPQQDMECNATFNFIGSTMMRRSQNGNGITRIGTTSTSGVNSTLTHTFKGFICDFFWFTHFNSLKQNLQKKVYNFTDSILYSDNVSSTTINYASGTFNFSNYTDFRPVANYDGTVTSGQINFVDNGSVTALRDFRLVADLDNLPVKYMTQDSLTYKDITGYKRPGGTDQRDAGAYQSISDKVTVKNIGTSSADFTPDYATVPLWNNTYFNNANILNGETNVIKLKSGESHDITSRVILDGNADVNQNFVISGQTPHYGDWALGASLSPGYGSTFQIDHFKNSFKVKLEDLTYSSVTGMPLYGIVGAVNSTYGFRNADDTPWRTISSKHEYEFENCMFRMDTSQGGNASIPIVFSRHYARITDSDGNLIERGEVHHTHRNCVFIGTGSDGLGIFVNQFGSADTKQVAQVIGCTIVNSTIGTGNYMSPGKFEGSAIGSLIYLDPSLISFRNAPKGLFDFAQTFGFPSGLPIYAIDCISNRATSSTFTEPHIGDPKYIVYSDTDLDTTNISYEVPFNFDGSVSAGTVSFVSGGASNYRLVATEDNLASGYVSSFDLSGLDLAGNDRGDSPYDAGAFAITLQQVEDFLKSLGGPLVLQVGYRISNNRQRLIPVIGGEE